LRQFEDCRGLRPALAGQILEKSGLFGLAGIFQTGPKTTEYLIFTWFILQHFRYRPQRVVKIRPAPGDKQGDKLRTCSPIRSFFRFCEPG
jgi:hypothetical protein